MGEVRLERRGFQRVLHPTRRLNGNRDPELFRTGMPEASILLKTYDLPPDLTDEWLDTVRQCRAAGVMIQVLHAHGSIASAVQRARDRGLLFVTFVHFRRYKVDDLIQLTADQVDYALTMHHHNLERLRDGFQLR